MSDSTAPMEQCLGCGQMVTGDERQQFYGKCAECCGYVWWTGMVECRICGDRHVTVMPIKKGTDPPDNQPCPKCKHPTCEPVEDDDEAPGA